MPETYDIDLVLRIAKHLAETGEPLPEATWEDDATQLCLKSRNLKS